MMSLRVSTVSVRHTAFASLRRDSVSHLWHHTRSSAPIWQKKSTLYQARPNRLHIHSIVSLNQSLKHSETPSNLLDQIPSILSRSLLTCCLAAAFIIFPSISFAASKATTAVDPSTASSGIVALAKAVLDFILHLDVHLGDIILQYGKTTYAILFAIVFAETGLVITPFLPGDSLLFATGALAALGKLNILALLTVYITAATIGDAVNYASM